MDPSCIDSYRAKGKSGVLFAPAKGSGSATPPPTTRHLQLELNRPAFTQLQAACQTEASE